MFPRRKPARPRRGAILYLTAFLLSFMLVVIALGLDFGYLFNARCELQRTADAASMAGCWQLIADDILKPNGDTDQVIEDTRLATVEYAAANWVAGSSPLVDGNEDNNPDGDILVGHLDSADSPPDSMEFDTPKRYNAVRVKIRRDAQRNGEVPFFFARIFGHPGFETLSEATAYFDNSFSGFEVPENNENLDILPFALDEETWNDMLAGGGSDNWTWNKESKTIGPGADGVREVNLYPQATGSPGNRGTVDIGSNNNSTSDLERQILEGISPADLAFHGGKLEFNQNGFLYLGADPGISAGMKDALAAIKGKPKIIPIFRTLTGTGNNAEYGIVAWIGVRILDVKLTGSNSTKRVIIQPANVVTKGGIPNETGQSSWYVYSTVRLIR
jgi:Flp pilus assembly protein TadG